MESVDDLVPACSCGARVPAWEDLPPCAPLRCLPEIPAIGSHVNGVLMGAFRRDDERGIGASVGGAGRGSPPHRPKKFGMDAGSSLW